MHVHVSALSFLVSFAYLILGLFLLLYIAAQWPDSPIGQAAAVLRSA